MTQRVLFLCGRNKLRSPTAERLYSAYPGIQVASAGVSDDAEVPVTPELLRWADIIFVMEQRHRSKLSRKFREYLTRQRVICLNIPDQYAYMDHRLIELLNASVPRHLGSSRAGGTSCP